MKAPKHITVLYEVVDPEEWYKTNPLHYSHNGLKAVQVGAYDAFQKIEELENQTPEEEE